MYFSFLWGDSVREWKEGREGGVSMGGGKEAYVSERCG